MCSDTLGLYIGLLLSFDCTPLGHRVMIWNRWQCSNFPHGGRSLTFRTPSAHTGDATPCKAEKTFSVQLDAAIEAGRAYFPMRPRLSCGSSLSITPDWVFPSLRLEVVIAQNPLATIFSRVSGAFPPVFFFNIFVCFCFASGRVYSCLLVFFFLMFSRLWVLNAARILLSTLIVRESVCCAISPSGGRMWLPTCRKIAFR